MGMGRRKTNRSASCAMNHCGGKATMGDQIVQCDMGRMPFGNAPLAPLLPAPGSVPKPADGLALGRKSARDMAPDESIGARHEHRPIHARSAFPRSCTDVQD